MKIDDIKDLLLQFEKAAIDVGGIEVICLK